MTKSHKVTIAVTQYIESIIEGDRESILSISAHFGLPIPSPEDIKEEELCFLLASVSTYLLKRAISGREDAEHIKFLWIEAETNMVKKSD